MRIGAPSIQQLTHAQPTKNQPRDIVTALLGPVSPAVRKAISKLALCSDACNLSDALRGMPKIDYEKRRRVMARSQALGHCICDPKQPCPCETFRRHGICHCAGERKDAPDSEHVKLTRLVRNAGCASKLPPAELEAVLTRLPTVTDPNVISGLAAGDDAAIYRISDSVCLVQTVDVFTPCVDDPYTFGRICAANCLSDVYAMGGQPRTALSVVSFPIDTVPGQVLYEMLAGAMQMLAEAGVALIGGHSIKDEEIKLGFAITGTIDPETAARLDTPQPGDLLVLTKPLGTGTLVFANQIGRPFQTGLAQAIDAMTTLNKAAAEAMIAAGASGAIDITGFGLFGHLVRWLRQKRLAARVFAGALPAFDQVLDALKAGLVPGAVERNREFVGSDLEVAGEIPEYLVDLGFDAQTSGGLLISVAPNRIEQLLHELGTRNTRGFVIGELLTGPNPKITLVPGSPTAPGRTSDDPGAAAQPTTPKTDSSMSADSACCCEPGHEKPGPETGPQAPRVFGEFLRTVAAKGTLDERTKELVLLGLVILARCEPCLSAHLKRARELGISETEIEEVAWCAIAMGGAPVMMFYKTALGQLGSHNHTSGQTNSRCCSP